jgi:hypothetical protein
MWIALLVMLFGATGLLSMEKQELLVLDDRSSDDGRAQNGAGWRLFTDGVMGGVSKGELTFDIVDNRRCMRLSGDVRLENNGGFVQIALDINEGQTINIEAYKGFLLDVYGNAEEYNVHLRTDETQRPWQSYRATFQAVPSWQTIFLPFSQFEPYRIETPMDPADIRRIGIVAIGRAFAANLCIGRGA